MINYIQIRLNELFNTKFIALFCYVCYIAGITKCIITPSIINGEMIFFICSGIIFGVLLEYQRYGKYKKDNEQAN